MAFMWKVFGNKKLLVDRINFGKILLLGKIIYVVK